MTDEALYLGHYVVWDCPWTTEGRSPLQEQIELLACLLLDVVGCRLCELDVDHLFHYTQVLLGCLFVAIDLLGCLHEFLETSLPVLSNEVRIKAKDHHQIKEINNQHFINLILKCLKELNGTDNTIKNKWILNTTLIIDRILILLNTSQNHFQSNHIFLLFPLLSGIYIHIAVGGLICGVNMISTQEHKIAMCFMDICLDRNVRMESWLELVVQAQDQLFLQILGMVHVGHGVYL